MLRLSRPHQTLRLKWATARGFAVPAGEGAAKVHCRPLSKDSYDAPLQVPAEGTFASELMKETESGKTAMESIKEKAAALAAKRREARLARESANGSSQGYEGRLARQAQTATHTQSTAPVFEINTRPLQSSQPDRRRQRRVFDVSTDQLTTAFSQPKGQGNRNKFNGQGGDRRSAAPSNNGNRNGNRNGPQRQQRAPPRSLMANKRPDRKQASEDAVGSLEDLVVTVDLPNSPGSISVSQDLSSVFPKEDSPLGPGLSAALAGNILRKFGGDYSAFAPTPSPTLYTTPVDKLPLRAQVTLAMAKSKGLNINDRKLVVNTVTKAIGEVPSPTVA
ncbi:hypothetical protein DFP72DRAFT_867403 [Ephemerocybe angulata]|uniref:Uncharacterized protein n=1 Tax=Ephemerocybe angulata TaxID=980116 RepID=A0A8H6ILM0_9AGAR|nr:hypothetical protein DFP72DRAFT_867403 [Tulosesus angulatus]